MGFLGDLFSGGAVGGAMAGAPLGPWGMAGGALLGAISAGDARKKQAADAALAAKTQELSPWTGLSAKPVEMAPTDSQSMLQGVGAGMQGMQANKNYDAQRQEQALKAQWINSQMPAGTKPATVAVTPWSQRTPWGGI